MTTIKLFRKNMRGTDDINNTVNCVYQNATSYVAALTETPIHLWMKSHVTIHFLGNLDTKTNTDLNECKERQAPVTVLYKKRTFLFIFFLAETEFTFHIKLLNIMGFLWKNESFSVILGKKNARKNLIVKDCKGKLISRQGCQKDFRQVSCLQVPCQESPLSRKSLVKKVPCL